MKLWDLRRVREKILTTQTPGVPTGSDVAISPEKEEVVQKIEATWEKDMTNMQALLASVNSAENSFYTFAGYYQQLLGDNPSEADFDSEQSAESQPGGENTRTRSVSLDDNMELGRVFNYLIRIRKLQKELDDVIAPTGGPQTEGSDSDTGEELSLEEIGHVGGLGTTSNSNVVPTSGLSAASASPTPVVSPKARSPPISPVTSSENVTLLHAEEPARVPSRPPRTLPSHMTSLLSRVSNSCGFLSSSSCPY